MSKQQPLSLDEILAMKKDGFSLAELFPEGELNVTVAEDFAKEILNAGAAGSFFEVFNSLGKDFDLFTEEEISFLSRVVDILRGKASAEEEGLLLAKFLPKGELNTDASNALAEKLLGFDAGVVEAFLSLFDEEAATLSEEQHPFFARVASLLRSAKAAGFFEFQEEK